MQVISRREAKASGINRYFDGIPCPQGHISPRYTSTSNCIECSRLAGLSRTPAAKARALELVRARAEANRKPKVETPRAAAIRLGLLTYLGSACRFGHGQTRYTKGGMCLTCASDAQKNPIIREYKRTYGQANKVSLARKASMRYLSAEAVARAKKWRIQNPEKRRAISWAYKAKRRLLEAAGDSSAEVGAWLKVTPKVCHWCGSKCGKDYHIDHYQPLSKGGRHIVANLVIACPKCNLTKNARDPYEFANTVGRLF